MRTHHESVWKRYLPLAKKTEISGEYPPISRGMKNIHVTELTKLAAIE